MAARCFRKGAPVTVLVVGKVVSSVDLGDKDAPRLFGVSNHGVTRGHPFGFGGYSFEAGAVD